MSEWRGPKQCPKCGAIDDGDPYDSSLLYHKAHCRVDMIPYERRKDDALAAMTRERDELKLECERHKKAVQYALTDVDRWRATYDRLKKEMTEQPRAIVQNLHDLSQMYTEVCVKSHSGTMMDPGPTWRELFDEACAVLALPDSTNDGGPSDLAQSIRDLSHNWTEAETRAQKAERERDEWKDAKHRCEDLAEEHIQRIESLQGALEECEKCIADFFVPGLGVGELDRARLALGRARVALGRQ